MWLSKLLGIIRERKNINIKFNIINNADPMILKESDHISERYEEEKTNIKEFALNIDGMLTEIVDNDEYSPLVKYLHLDLLRSAVTTISSDDSILEFMDREKIDSLLIRLDDAIEKSRTESKEDYYELSKILEDISLPISSIIEKRIQLNNEKKQYSSFKSNITLSSGQKHSNQKKEFIEVKMKRHRYNIDIYKKELESMIEKLIQKVSVSLNGLEKRNTGITSLVEDLIVLSGSNEVVATKI